MRDEAGAGKDALRRNLFLWEFHTSSTSRVFRREYAWPGLTDYLKNQDAAFFSIIYPCKKADVSAQPEVVRSELLQVDSIDFAEREVFPKWLEQLLFLVGQELQRLYASLL